MFVFPGPARGAGAPKIPLFLWDQTVSPVQDTRITGTGQGRAADLPEIASENDRFFPVREPPKLSACIAVCLIGRRPVRAFHCPVLRSQKKAAKFAAEILVKTLRF